MNVKGGIAISLYSESTYEFSQQLTLFALTCVMSISLSSALVYGKRYKPSQI